MRTLLKLSEKQREDLQGCPWCHELPEVKLWTAQPSPDIQTFVGCRSLDTDCRVCPAVLGETLQDALDAWNSHRKGNGTVTDPRDKWIALACAAIVGGAASPEHAGKVLTMLAEESGYAPREVDQEAAERHGNNQGPLLTVAGLKLNWCANPDCPGFPWPASERPHPGCRR